ncbi:MAG: hypothetical protein JWO90_1129, partial [Solirubrobacterales bacterium]|nr:hypothetical protein [Solirubrobacterales bacterium]
MNARRCLALALLGCLALPATAVAGAGDRDSAFGEDGARTYGLDTAPGSPSDGAVAALPQPGGGALLVGAIRTEALDPNGDRIDRVALLRTTSTGAPDTSFGPDGLVLLPAAVGTVAHDAVALPDGDVLVLAGGVSDGAGHGEYVLFRANADGTPDTSFSGDGLVQTGYDAFRDVPVDGGVRSGYGVSGRALALVGGRAVVAAAVSAHADFTESSSYSYSSAVAAHDPATGALDAAWGTRSGTTLLAPPSGYASFAQVADVAAAPGGKALVLDELVPSGSLERAAVHRLADDGTRDPAFGDADPGDPTDDGVAIVRFKPGAADGTVAEDGTAVLALPGGGVAVAGGVTPLDDPFPARQQAAVARLTDTGDADGVALVDAGQDGDRAFEALALVEGALHAAGRNVDHDGTGPGQREGWLVRFTGEDAPFAADPGFGVDGIARGGVPSWVHDLAATDDGFALAVGAAASSDDTAWTAARWDARDARLPVNAERPRVADAGIGIVAVGETLTAFDGTWHYGGVVTRRWQRCTTAHDPSAPAAGAGCADIADATGREYTVTPADADRHLRVVVTNASGTFTATAAAATIEAYAPPEPTAFTTPPAVAPTGSVPAGTTVRATWTATGAQPLDADVRWFRCPTATTGPCEPVTGDDTTDATYLASPADVGTFLRAIVELSGPGGFDSAQTTNATGVTAATDATAPQATVAPTTTPAGPVTEGTTLSRASDGTWDQDGLAFTHRWERCDAAGAGCAPIPGAGAPSYATTSADVGRRVRLVVEARRGSGPLGASAS